MGPTPSLMGGIGGGGGGGPGYMKKTNKNMLWRTDAKWLKKCMGFFSWDPSGLLAEKKIFGIESRLFFVIKILFLHLFDIWVGLI